MDDSEKRYLFREADTLYRKRQYEQALDILRGLDEGEPNTRHILYPIARCLSRLERYEEAIELAGEIARQFDYAPAQDLHDKLNRHTESDPKIDMTAFDVDLGGPLELEDKKASPPSSATFKLKLGIGLVFTFALAVICRNTVMVEFWDWFASTNGQPDPTPTIPIQSAITVLAEILLLGYIGGCTGTYIGLIAANSLPYPTFDENVRDIARIVFLGSLLALIPIIGWIGILIMLTKHYNLNFGRMTLFCLVSTTFGGVANFGLLYGVEFVAARI